LPWVATQTAPGKTSALAGDDQEAHGGAGKTATCHKNVIEASCRRNTGSRHVRLIGQAIAVLT
jgi:hypothetical protein